MFGSSSTIQKTASQVLFHVGPFLEHYKAKQSEARLASVAKAREKYTKSSFWSGKAQRAVVQYLADNPSNDFTDEQCEELNKLLMTTSYEAGWEFQEQAFKYSNSVLFGRNFEKAAKSMKVDAANAVGVDRMTIGVHDWARLTQELK